MPKERDWRDARARRTSQIHEQMLKDRQRGAYAGKSSDDLRKAAEKRAERDCRIASNEADD